MQRDTTFRRLTHVDATRVEARFPWTYRLLPLLIVAGGGIAFEIAWLAAGFSFAFSWKYGAVLGVLGYWALATRNRVRISVEDRSYEVLRGLLPFVARRRGSLADFEAVEAKEMRSGALHNLLASALRRYGDGGFFTVQLRGPHKVLVLDGRSPPDHDRQLELAAAVGEALELELVANRQRA